MHGGLHMDVRMIICGMGRVGQAFLNLLIPKNKDPQRSGQGVGAILESSLKFVSLQARVWRLWSEWQAVQSFPCREMEAGLE